MGLVWGVRLRIMCRLLVGSVLCLVVGGIGEMGKRYNAFFICPL